MWLLLPSNIDKVMYRQIDKSTIDKSMFDKLPIRYMGHVFGL